MQVIDGDRDDLSLFLTEIHILHAYYLHITILLYKRTYKRHYKKCKLHKT